ncbi:MAG: hypothetical protein HY292_15075 [Planctomycetes bacterium]|nr:hypothetical protein [Planctomycetota bacterium]
MDRHLSIRALSAAFVLAAATALASDFEKVTPRELTRRSTDVVVARVISVRTEMGPLPGVTGDVPIRRVTVTVVEAWRGDTKAGDSLDVLVPGGTSTDGTSLMVSSSPSTDALEGREIVAFVRRNAFGAGRHGFESGSLGVYRVDERRGGSDVTRRLRGQAGSAFPQDVDLPAAQDVIRSVPTERGR